MYAASLNQDECRRRQKRLLTRMEAEQLDWVVLAQREHVQWLTGVRVPWVFQSGAVINSDGHVWLAVPEPGAHLAAAHDVVTFSGQEMATLRNDQHQRWADALWEALEARPKPKRVGYEFSAMPNYLARRVQAEAVDIDPVMLELRRRKDVDELYLIGRAIAATERMYARAREIIRPGITELEVFNELQAAAVSELGEMLTATGNDYQCAAPGGPPRPGRKIEDGELYILDLGPAFRGYFADNCRTIAVGAVSDLQHRAWEALLPVFEHVERTVRPGVSARKLYEDVREMLLATALGEFPHHLGHGFGLFPHEPPHLSPVWDDVFQEGDVFAVEPGLYSPDLQGGVRIEQNYLVTASGLELLTDFSIELTGES